MDIYVVTSWASHDGCIDAWRNVDEDHIEGVFDSKEEAMFCVHRLYAEHINCGESIYYDSEGAYIEKYILNSGERDLIYQVNFTTREEDNYETICN